MTKKAALSKVRGNSIKSGKDLDKRINDVSGISKAFSFLRHSLNPSVNYESLIAGISEGLSQVQEYRDLQLERRNTMRSKPKSQIIISLNDENIEKRIKAIDLKLGKKSNKNEANILHNLLDFNGILISFQQSGSRDFTKLSN